MDDAPRALERVAGRVDIVALGELTVTTIKLADRCLHEITAFVTYPYAQTC
jgi:hypothetical protein